jgi:phospholipid/cholesterol/gamma-HCH transport system substrate-binding protein
MSDSRLQFRVGLFVIGAIVVATCLALRFGELAWLWEKNYSLAIHFDQAPGVMKGVPVRKNGVTIGRVRDVYFDEKRGGVMVITDIAAKYPLRVDSQVQLTQSLLGDATIEFSPGKSPDVLKPGATLDGSAPMDPMKVLVTLGTEVHETLGAFKDTSREWQKVGKNVNSIVETNRGDLRLLTDQAADSLHEFSLAMKSINGYLKDEQNEANLKRTLASLPKLAAETQETIIAIRSAVHGMDETVANINKATAPLARRSESIVAKLDASTGNLELLLAELNTFSRALNAEDGSMHLLVSDPHLYRNLNQSASTLNTLMRNLDPIVQDLRVFSDKVARDPGVLGVRGVLKSSPPIKQATHAEPGTRRN